MFAIFVLFFVLLNLRLNTSIMQGFPTVSFNNVPVDTKKLDVPMNGDIYVGYYYFQPGDPVNIECLSSSGLVELTLISDQNGDILFNSTLYSNNREILMKLTKYHNNTYLECSHPQSDNDLYIRIYLYINNRVIPAEDLLIIKINAEPLRSNPTLDTTSNTAVIYLVYDLTYTSKKGLNITCEKNEKSERELKLNVKELYGNYEDVKPTSDGIVFKYIKTRDCNSFARVTCSLKTNQGNFIDYVITFVNRILLYDIHLSGLSTKNILLDYKRMKQKIHEIHYLYDNNETLNLKCTGVTPMPDISLNMTGNISSTINANEAVITLNPSNNNSVVTCFYGRNFDYKTMIHLIYQNQPILDNSITITSNAEDTAIISESNIILWSVISALIVVAVIVLIACRACVTRRKPQRPQLPLPESLKPDTITNTSENVQEPEYEEIPETVPCQRPVNKLDLRRLYGMRMNSHTQVLYVLGNRIDLKIYKSNSEEPRALQ